jgi:hypothetical protein
MSNSLLGSVSSLLRAASYGVHQSRLTDGPDRTTNGRERPSIEQVHRRTETQERVRIRS